MNLFYRWILMAMIAGMAFGQTIVVAPDAPANVQLAAKEIRRYAYLRTGKLLPIAATGQGIALAIDPALGAQEYRIESNRIAGGSDVGVLYGAYRYAELLGVRFYLHGDVIPDGRLNDLPVVKDERGKPLFETRGILPFHDFPEGPDWWTTDDYRSCVAQLVKMRMNFMGFHQYAYEPLVWRGVAEDVAADGTVKTSYPAYWFNNLNGQACYSWGLATAPTSAFPAGAAEMFASDGVESDALGKDGRHFDRVGKLLGRIVADAHARGVKICVGSESPVSIPGPAAQRMKDLGKTDLAREAYKGSFTWLMKNAPVDYYWLWTPEGWIWSGNSMGQFKATENDLRAALGALDDLGKPFPLGASGWVLGPQQDRTAWDRLLPKDSPIANINPEVGHAPLDPGFSDIQGRPKWAIPWLENDPDLAAYQPWVKRLRYDAADALRQGCTGLMGIHWRTRILSANIAALAQAGWDQSWTRPERFVKRSRGNPGHPGAFTEPVAGSDQDPIYQTLRYGLSRYPVEVPNGSYTVTLKFNEPHHNRAGARVFGVSVQGKPVAEHLDVFARVGKNHALDIPVPGVRVTHGVVDIAFSAEIEYPFLAGVEIVGTASAGTGIASDGKITQVPERPFARRINVGGPAWQPFEADIAKDPSATSDGLDRAMPADDFYVDFARANFGDALATRAGMILADADGFGVDLNPRRPGFAVTTQWGLRVVRDSWENQRAPYQFAERFASLRPQVIGAGNLERFDYWMHTLNASALMMELACQRGQLDLMMEPLTAATDPTAKRRLAASALGQRRQLARGWEKLLRLQIAVTSTPGELGTLSALYQRTIAKGRWLTTHDKLLESALGTPLPADCAVAMTYDGPGKLTPLSIRSIVDPGESLKIPIIALAKKPLDKVTVHIRALGHGDWQTVPATHVARAVFEAKLPAARDDFEYYITAGEGLVWPAGAPALNQTVIVAP